MWVAGSPGAVIRQRSGRRPSPRRGVRSAPSTDGRSRHDFAAGDGRMTDRGFIWLDGELLPSDGLHLSVFDRGFQLGDGVFETLRARAGNVTELDEHLARLHRSATGLSIPLGPDVDPVIRAGIAGVLRANGLDGPTGDASIRITASRGA